MGRPSKLTRTLIDEMVTDLKKGHYRNTVARAHGVHIATFCTWMDKGEKARPGDDIYVEFREAVEKAQAVAEIELGNTAMNGDGVGIGNGKAKCAQWMLQRTRGKKFGEKISVKVEEELSIWLEVAALVLEDDQYVALLSAMEAVDDEGFPTILSTPVEPESPATH